MMLMTPDRLQKEIERFDHTRPIECAWMPPSSWYTDEAFYTLERQAVLGTSWQPVARQSALINPGDYTAGCFLGWPWLLAKGEDGQIRGFHNACRHKGREVVTGTGHTNDALVCGYHAWAYDLQGRLKRAPQIGGIQDFDRDAMSLPPLATALWGHWIWINFAPNPPPLLSRIQPLDDALRPSGWDKLTYVGTREWIIQCNWKVYIDNYLDGGYHIPHMHPSLDAQLDMDSYRTELFDFFSIQTSAPTTSSDNQLITSPKERIGDGAIYAWLYPNFMLNQYGNCLDTNYVLPLGHDRCKVIYEFYFGETEAPEAMAFIEASMAQSDITQQEDIEICESVQIGLGSPAYDRGRYAPRIETGEYHFHRLLAEDYIAALDTQDKG